MQPACLTPEEAARVLGIGKDLRLPIARDR